MLAFEDLALSGDVLEPGRQRLATLDARGEIGLDDARDADRRARASRPRSRSRSASRRRCRRTGPRASPSGASCTVYASSPDASAAECPRSAGIGQMPPEEIEHRVLGLLVLDVRHVGRGVEHDARGVDPVARPRAPRRRRRSGSSRSRRTGSRAGSCRRRSAPSTSRTSSPSPAPRWRSDASRSCARQRHVTSIVTITAEIVAIAHGAG